MEHAAEAEARDEVKPRGEWAFDAEVTRVFDDMLRRSIPQYDVMRAAVFEVGRRHMAPKGHVVDLGCSRGEALAPFVQAFPLRRFVGVEVSEPMRDAAEGRFQANPNVKILGLDLRNRNAFPDGHAALVLSVLTLQFIPIEHRQSVIRRVKEHLTPPFDGQPGGAFVLVEKVLGASSALDDAFVDAHHETKMLHGYTQDDVIRKRASLEGVMVPVTASMNEGFLRAEGFRTIDCFWRWMNFAAWIAVP